MPPTEDGDCDMLSPDKSTGTEQDQERLAGSLSTIWNPYIDRQDLNLASCRLDFPPVTPQRPMSFI